MAVGVLAVVPSSRDLPDLLPRGRLAVGCRRQCPPLAKPGLWTWPGPQDGLGRGGLRLKWAKGRFWSKIDEKIKVLRMGLPIVEILSGLQENIFNLSRGPQLHFGEKSKKWSNFIKFTDFPLFPLFEVPWAAVIRLEGMFRHFP